jgi:hypothetical protein
MYLMLFFFFSSVGRTSGQLEYEFYDATCPNVEETARQVLQLYVTTDPTSSASILRLSFHDCQVQVLPLVTFLHRFLCEENKYAVMSFSYSMRRTVPSYSPGHGFFFPRGLACGPNLLPVRIFSTPVSDVPQQAICGSNIAYQAYMRKFCFLSVAAQILPQDSCWSSTIEALNPGYSPAQGYDASVMLDSANGITTELDASSSFSIRRLDIIGVKATLEEACPNTVSCADIIAMAGPEAVASAGGPRITIPLWRRDSTFASTSEASASLPQPNISMDQFMNLFASYGMSLPHSVAIMG